MLLAQSGFSEVYVSCFRIEELKGLYDSPETEHYSIEKPREKTNEIQATCLNYEAVHDLKVMLQERDNPETGFLFVSQTKDKGVKRPIERRCKVVLAGANDEKGFRGLISSRSETT
jgi:hypothetical protein